MKLSWAVTTVGPILIAAWFYFPFGVAGFNSLCLVYARMYCLRTGSFLTQADSKYV